MKILVLDKDMMERTVVQQVLQYNGHEIISAEDSQTALRMLEGDEIRLVLADRTTTDIDETGFIQRVRRLDQPYQIYILLITPKVKEGDITNPRSGADDTLHKPIVPLELKTRVQIAERILRLGDNLQHAKAALENLSMLDPTTNILNKTAFLTFSRGELERARRAQAPLSMIAVEIENLASLKEHYGRTTANDLLTLTAQGIREKSRPYDGLGRYDEGTFMLVLPGILAEDAEKIADRILKAVLNNDIALLDGTPVNQKLNVGVVGLSYISASTGIEALIERAEETLVHARREGGNQVHTVVV